MASLVQLNANPRVVPYKHPDTSLKKTPLPPPPGTQLASNVPPRVACRRQCCKRWEGGHTSSQWNLFFFISLPYFYGQWEGTLSTLLSFSVIMFLTIVSSSVGFILLQLRLFAINSDKTFSTLLSTYLWVYLCVYIRRCVKVLCFLWNKSGEFPAEMQLSGRK